VSADGYPPPPPPPDLAPPPGYAGYQARPWGAVTLKRVGGLARAIMVLLAICAVAQLVLMLFIPGYVEDSRDFADGLIDEDTYVERQVGFVGMSFISGAASIAVVVLSIIWLFRIAKNHRSLQRSTTWGPAWAIAGWVVPPLLFVIPTLMLREQWQAAEPSSPPGDQSWRASRPPALVWVWFVVYSAYSISPIVFAATGASAFGSGFGGDVADAARDVADSPAALWVPAVLLIVSAVLWGLVVRGITTRQRRLTGEDSAR
jgi:hypothetical protein